MNIKDIVFLMNVAKMAAEQSYAVRLKVGGVVTDSIGNIIAYGYNGTISGMENTCEDKFYPADDQKNGLIVNDQIYPLYDFVLDKPYRLKTKDNVIHCEQNLIAHAARRGISINDGMVFLTHSPCMHCTSCLIQSGISQVYYAEKFRTFNEVFETYKHKLIFTELAQ